MSNNGNHVTIQQSQNAGRSINAFVRITEQPTSTEYRFRYESEGRAGSIPGASSSPTNKTFPSIQVVGYSGNAVVVVSCVTKDEPYRPHPHKLVGERCEHGICQENINSETTSVTFSNLGLQCVRHRDVERALIDREEKCVDPYETGFSHRSQPSSIDLKAVRLCFQLFLEQSGRWQKLPPIVSNPIFDKKAISDLVICRISHPSSTVDGGMEIMLLCEKVVKEDISVRFFEEINDSVVWEGYGDFRHTDVHKQVAITFRTPCYKSIDIEQPVRCYIQLQRPSDGETSEPLPFDYIPLSTRKRKKPNFDFLYVSSQPNDEQLFESTTDDYKNLSEILDMEEEFSSVSMKERTNTHSNTGSETTFSFPVTEPLTSTAALSNNNYFNCGSLTAGGQSSSNLCEGACVQLDESTALTEAEQYPLFTSIAHYATDEQSCQVEDGETLTHSEVIRMLHSNFC